MSKQPSKLRLLPPQPSFKFRGRGTQLVEQTLNQMLGLREAVVAISQPNQRLYDSTSQIGNISTLGSLVSDLASQTNIQAVNTAVEAVRAGEYGKGLAVVASEIRFLSR